MRRVGNVACYDARAMRAPPGKAAILPEAGVLPTFDPNCRRCARLASFLDVVRAEHDHYHCRPVPPFGAPAARLVIVGLAPGLHGANASGRPFTGDHAGILLYETLHAYGFASRPKSVSRDDGLALFDCRITNAVKCLPPGNKPLPAEVRACNGFLAADLSRLPAGGVVLALGRIAHDAALRALGRPPSAFAFAHGARHPLPNGAALFDSYHCSRYNTNTRRLTPAMFRAVFDDIAAHLGRAARAVA
jgi:uracil-DNA glycosylase family 4